MLFLTMTTRDNPFVIFLWRWSRLLSQETSPKRISTGLFQCTVDLPCQGLQFYSLLFSIILNSSLVDVMFWSEKISHKQERDLANYIDFVDKREVSA